MDETSGQKERVRTEEWRSRGTYSNKTEIAKSWIWKRRRRWSKKREHYREGRK